MPVVKANAYGHGAIFLSKSAEKAGYDFFAVAFLEEALELREHGIKSDILVFNFLLPDMLHVAQEKNITITIYSFEQLEMYKDLPFIPKVHLKIDTGMRRLGVEPEKAKELYKKALEYGFDIKGAYTHLAVADESKPESKQFTLKQAETFLKYVPDVEIKHICNSGGAIQKILGCFDYVRVGIASYGLKPSDEIYSEELKPVLSWKSVVSFVKTIKPGDSVSYGRTFVADREMKVATIPVGYADGYWRSLSNKGEVLIRGKRCKILGRVCMDQFVVDVSHLKDVKIGDEVVLIGSQGNEKITAEEIAKLVGTINYEVTCRISERVPRLFEGMIL